MHIVHVVESFGGGVIGFVEQLCRHLPHHRHTVVHAVRPAEVDPAVTKARFPAEVGFCLWPHAVREIAPLADARALFALLDLMPALQPDVVHLHSSKAGFLGRLACHALRISTVVYTPGGVALLRQDISWAKRVFYGLLECVGSLFAGIVVACGPSEAEALAAFGVPARVIANGTEPGPAPVPRQPTDGLLTVLGMGRATAQKNPAAFARIATALLPDGQFRFVWVGSGELEACLHPPAVLCTGWVPSAEARRLLQEADVYVSTSVWEGLSLAVLEAMSAGLPLVLSACAGNTDVVLHGENGYLFSQEQQAVRHLRALAQDPALRQRMGAASRARLVAQHDVHQVAAQYDLIYKAWGPSGQ